VSHIHVRLRDETDGDINTWYETQEDKSRAVRDAIRAAIQVEQSDVLHIELRPGRDDDITAWCDAQGDKATAVRAAIRAVMRLQNGDTQEAIVKEAVARELARLPDVVAATVREALAAYRLAPAEVEREPGAEDPELAGRLDSTLDDFFSE